MTSAQWTVETNDAAQTRAAGERLGRLLAGGDVLALVGELGAGKTAFTQGVAQGLGVNAAVTSPTFVLINRYHGAHGNVLQHADCYRLQHAAAEMWDAGLTELWTGDDIVVVEWADRLAELLPEEHLEVVIEYVDENCRQLRFIAHGDRYVALLQQLKTAHWQSSV